MAFKTVNMDCRSLVLKRECRAKLFDGASSPHSMVDIDVAGDIFFVLCWRRAVGTGRHHVSTLLVEYEYAEWDIRTTCETVI